MASKHSNLFDLLAGGGESDDDVADLCERMKKKADEQVPSSPPKTRKEYIVFAENSEHTDSKEEAQANGNENGSKSDEEGWQVVPKKVYRKKFQENEVQENIDELANGDATELTKENGDVKGKKPKTNGKVNGNGNGRGGKKKGSGGNRGRGKGGVVNGRGDNGEVKDLTNGSNGNGDGVDAGHNIVSSEGDAAVTVESSNDKETEEKETTEEVKSDVPEREETAEERKERLRNEQIRKDKEEWAERRRLKRLEAAEEAKKMTLDQYEKILSKKKRALNLKKAEARRVVSADEDFENMKAVGKKLDNDETLIVESEKPKGKAAPVKSEKPKGKAAPVKSEKLKGKAALESKLKKSESFEKEPEPLADRLAKLFRPASFRGVRSGRGRDHENKGGFRPRFPSQNGSTGDDLPSNNGAPDEKVLKEEIPLEDEIQFPVVGFVPPVLPPSESSAPAANPSTSSEPNSSESSEPPANPSTLSAPNSSESSAPPVNPSTLSAPNSSESSAPPANPSTSAGPKSAEPANKRPYLNSRKGKRSNNKHNRPITGNRPTTTAANGASGTHSATAASSSVRAER